MSLIDRLQRDANPDGVFGRALTMRESRTVAPEGPLPEVVDSITPPKGNTDAESIVPGAAIRSLLKELQTQKHFGITTPSHLFSLVHRHLLVKRGAILVPHRDGGMVPLATAGLDKTSAFRIRLSAEEVAWLGSGKSAIILDDTRRETFIRRLSKADARNAPRIVLFPFTHLRETVAVLVIADSPVLHMDPNVLDVIVGALSESAGRLLFDGRQRPFDRRVSSSVFTYEHLPSILERLQGQESGSDRRILLIDVEIGPLINRIIENHSHLDQSRLSDDILETTALLTETSYSVVNRGERTLTLVGREEPTAPPELVAHLLTVTLSSLFGCAYPETLKYTVRTAEEYGTTT